MNRIYIDMDGVVVDFDRYAAEHKLTPAQIKNEVGAYQRMPPMPHAIESVRSLIAMGFEVWLATKPPTGIPHAYADKVSWVLNNLPELDRRIVITHDKGMLGDHRDFLIDDRPHRANCKRFDGMLMHFASPWEWPMLVAHFRSVAAIRNIRPRPALSVEAEADA